MPSFGEDSTQKLNTLVKPLQDLLLEVIKTYDCKIICGFRGEKEQNEAFEKGYSQKKWPQSNHNIYPSRAVDVAPYNNGIKWDDIDSFNHFAGYVRGIAAQMGIKIRWGGDWNGNFDLKDQSFFDRVHFEILD